MADNNQDTYLLLYDLIPENWEEGRQFLVEQLKKIGDIVNLRQVGWFLDEELLTGQQFIPGNNNVQEYRTAFRKVIDTGALIIGINTVAHGITFDTNFTLTHMYGAATDNALPKAIPIPNGLTTIYMDATNIVIDSAEAYPKSFVVIEYLKEL